MRVRFAWLLCVLASIAFAQQTGSLAIVSGNGQVTLEQFRTTLPLTVAAKDTAGRPLAGIPVQWSITTGQGTITGAMTSTDASGQAGAYFLSTDLQPGTSWSTSTVTAQTPVGSASFFVTTTPRRTLAGTQAELPLAELLTPTLENRTISGRAGSVVPGAVQVRVTAQAGVSQGLPVPNVGVRIMPPEDSVNSATASCNTPDGVVLTNAQGIATCNVLLGLVVGTAQVAASVGEYRTTPTFYVQVTPGPSCTYALSLTSQLFAANGGSGSLNVNTQQGCAWTASSNATWISISTGLSGTGGGPLTFTVASNAGPSRTGTLTIAGQTFTVTQNTAAATGLTVLTAALPTATAGVPFSVALEAVGGAAPYRWSTPSALPAGIVLGQGGVLSGNTSATGTFPLVVTATDAANNSVSRNLALTVVSAVAGPVITTTSLPAGATGVGYQQPITVSGGCLSPFSRQPTVALAAGNLPSGLQLSLVAGVGYAISGIPTANGVFAFTLRVSDSCGRSSTRELSITISGIGTSTQLIRNPQSLTFNLHQGSNLALTQTVLLDSIGGPVEFSATATSSPSPWLIISGINTGATPASLTVGVVNAVNLAGGTYTGTVNITSNAGPASIPVTLNITATPVISLPLTSAVFDLRAGEVSNQSIRINSTGPAHVNVVKSAEATWLSVSPSRVEVPGNLNLTANALNLAPGSYFGVIRLEGPSNSINFPITLLVRERPQIIAQPASLTFRHRLNSLAPPPQELVVGSSGEAYGFSIAAAVSTGNWLIVTPQRGATPARLTISVAPAGLAPGTYTGEVTILSFDPAVPASVVRVTLVVENNAPRVNAVVNAASYQGGAVAPGQYVTLFGENLGPAALTSGRIVNNELDTQAGGTRILVDGAQAPIIYASANQTAAILPYSLAGKTTAQLVVEYAGERSAPVTLTVAETAPGVFLQFDGQYGAILNQNGSLNTALNPAAPESVVSIFATGEGQTIPAGSDGLIAAVERLPAPAAAVKVFIDGRQAEILYAGAAPGAPAGALQVNARIPGEVRGSVPVTVQVGARASRSVLIAVAP